MRVKEPSSLLLISSLFLRRHVVDSIAQRGLPSRPASKMYTAFCINCPRVPLICFEAISVVPARSHVFFCYLCWCFCFCYFCCFCFCYFCCFCLSHCRRGSTCQITNPADCNVAILPVVTKDLVISSRLSTKFYREPMIGYHYPCSPL